MTVTRDQAQQLATLARALRPHGATRWDEAGILAAIGAVKHLDLAEVAMVVITGATDRSLETPAAIGNTRTPLWQGRWRNPEPTRHGKPTICHTHGVQHHGTCPACRADELAGDHEETA